MVRIKFTFWWLALAWTGCTWGCAEYAQQEPGTRCTRDQDCETGKECGVFPACVDGRCDPDHSVTVACAEGCESDRDCVLATTDCCCGTSLEDAIAVLAGTLAEWENRAECREAICLEIECPEPIGVSAVCESGKCSVEAQLDSWDQCISDSDCVHVPIGCPSCDCHAGYGEMAINGYYESAYLLSLDRECASMGACAPGPFGVDACTNRPGICVRGQCEILSEDCDCETYWDPVCVSHFSESITVPNRCHADCLGLTPDYRGRCECEAGCLDPDPVCATNGETYWCGASEATCSGHQVAYSGNCSSACDYCRELDRPPIPVCTEEFQSYTDVCYAECHDQRWWHEGSCLPGEGNDCDNGWEQVACPREDLFCLNRDYCQDCPGCACPGTCIALGHCMLVTDCHNQPLATPECPGSWSCDRAECNWICD